MKLTFRAFALLLMAALTLGSVTTTEARVPAKKNTAAKKRSTSGKGGGMSAAKLKNNKLICYNYGMEEGLMMKSSIGLDPSDIGWNFGFKVFGGNYSVVGNSHPNKYAKSLKRALTQPHISSCTNRRIIQSWLSRPR